MTAIITCPEDVINLALARIGNRMRVRNIFEGSASAMAALDIYSQTRDEIIRDGDYEFSFRSVVPTLLKSAPIWGYVPPNTWNPATNPPQPWAFEYAYPSDCLKVRAVKPQPIFVPNFDPQPHLFAVANDNAFTPAQRVILSNVPTPIMTYAAQVTDPATWDVSFIDAFAAALAVKLAPVLANMDQGKVEAVKIEASDEQMKTAKADMVQG